MSVVELDELVAAARALLVPGGRAILGITGAPGSGKSTLAQQLADALGPQAALVGLDGFHLADSELHRLGRHARKGAADTFDAAGYVHLLLRLRDRSDQVVYAPTFDRGLEAALATAKDVNMMGPLLIKGFAGAVLGGLASLSGVFIGGLLASEQGVTRGDTQVHSACHVPYYRTRL